MTVIRGHYKVCAGVPSVVGVMEHARSGLALLMDDPPLLDDWPLEEGDELVVTRRARVPLDASEA